ncbi:MAG: hypothetical protein ACD_78C00121G0003 [uncultured bacterium (gcode 4)]|uniref:Caib/baif family protein n=1 Tax=uncultured bacterium (gcode 4) TaxID=1234023 RepID=K1XZ31_9BACT|nr:MAG: hypothetical protein ACD_78C00121G0003 [uncultured bacterium (gcode 4)]
MQQETIIESKICKHCSANFDITDKDLEFYEKISPVFGGVKYAIPSPTLCPDCRLQRKMPWRNEKKLYKRKCDFSWDDIVSVYSPDKPYKAYTSDKWLSDKWDPMDYGQDFDFTRPFFEQFHDFSKKVPKLALHIDVSMENCNYCNYWMNSSNCYMCIAASWSQECLYSNLPVKSLSDNDGEFNIWNQHCYECIHCNNCYDSQFLWYSQECKNSYFLLDCNNCSNCFWCVNLQHKEYCFFGEQLTKEEYESKVSGIMSHNSLREKYRKEYENFILWFPRKSVRNTNSENCLGDYIQHSKNCTNCFSAIQMENCKDTDSSGVQSSYIYSCYYVGNWSNFLYENIWLSQSTKTVSCVFWRMLESCFYCVNMSECSHCFWCTWLRNKSYCILNRQYTKEEYEELIPKIIEHMQEAWEWWEFFPSNLSPFGYNETVAQEYFPLDKENAIQKWFNWSDYEPPFPRVEKIIPSSKLPDDIAKIPDDILNWAIECEVTQKPFRIIKQELEFYRKHNIPVPRRHPDQRHLDRMNLQNPRKLFERKCDKCGVEMMTTYAPERPEIVYCEGCYEKEVY